jgi:Domain of unknown function (DUF4258)
MPVTLAMRWQFCLFWVFILFASCNSTGSDANSSHVGNTPFDRHGKLILTKHARCRMDCRHITLQEIREIVNDGVINYEKSEPNSHPDPKYALEGYTEEKQHLRIIVAPENEKLIIVTCIELGVEWQCDCN